MYDQIVMLGWTNSLIGRFKCHCWCLHSKHSIDISFDNTLSYLPALTVIFSKSLVIVSMVHASTSSDSDICWLIPQLETKTPLNVHAHTSKLFLRRYFCPYIHVRMIDSGLFFCFFGVWTHECVCVMVFALLVFSVWEKCVDACWCFSGFMSSFIVTCSICISLCLFLSPMNSVTPHKVWQQPITGFLSFDALWCTCS